MNTRPLNFLSLFTGIGGLDLGLERAGMRCVGQVEIDPFCRCVLAKHWPDVPRFTDVRKFSSRDLHEPVDLISGGFPCQDISAAGKRAGIDDGERSGLWREFYRLIRDLQPRFALVENVSALLNRGLDRVLGDLAAIGYDAEWEVISACTFGAPHTRERVFIVAYPAAGHAGQHGEQAEGQGWPHRPRVWRGFWDELAGHPWWKAEPAVSRVDDGLPAYLDHWRGYGNAVVPQVAEWIGRRIVDAASAAGAR